MASLSAVKLAIKRGKKEDALYLLRKVMKEQPTAECYYLAAKLAPNNIMARKQLQRALDLDPSHEPSHMMLQLIEREAAQTRTGKLRSELVEAFEDDALEDDDETTRDYVSRIKSWMFVGTK